MGSVVDIAPLGLVIIITYDITIVSRALISLPVVGWNVGMLSLVRLDSTLICDIYTLIYDC